MVGLPYLESQTRDLLGGVRSLDFARTNSGALGVGVRGCDPPTFGGANCTVPPVLIPGPCCSDASRIRPSIVNG